MLSVASPDQIPVLHAVVLGIVQGLSEFLPISSSGHLILVPWLFGWTELTGPAHAELNRTFDVALHLGTFVGAAAYFRADLARLAGAAWTSLRSRRVDGADQRQAWLLALSALPGATAGAVLESKVGDSLGEIWVIGVMLIVFGLVLLVADRLPGDRDEARFGRRDAAVMGLCQAGALVPGVSRSGITITAGRFLGFQRDAAARLSFLMSLPIIAGAGIYQGAKVLTGDGLPSGVLPAFVWGMLASGLTGAAAVWLVLRVVRTQSFAPFVIYRVVVGLTVLGLLATNFR